MNKTLLGMTQDQRFAYKTGFDHGKKEGLEIAMLIIKLAQSDTTKEFKEAVLQNSEEAVELRKVFGGCE